MTEDEGAKLVALLRCNPDYARRRLELSPIAEGSKDVALIIHRLGAAKWEQSRVFLELTSVSDLAETAIGRQLREEEVRIDYKAIAPRSRSREK